MDAIFFPDYTARTGAVVIALLVISNQRISEKEDPGAYELRPPARQTGKLGSLSELRSDQAQVVGARSRA